MTGPPAVPRATLRLQFSQAFRFDDATALVPYLAGLGVSHIYASPFLQARAGSTHGYDIIDHSQVNREIGDDAAFDRLVDALHAHGMGLILDFVPNHMGVGGSDNAWWLDVLEWGPDSPFAPFFDIDWTPPEPALHGKVLLPFLGDHYGNVLERGELALRLDEVRGTFSVWFCHHRFPVAVRHYPRLLRAVQQALGAADETLAGLINAFTGIGAGGGKSVPQQAILRRRVDELKAQLAALAAGTPAVAQAIADMVAQVNGVPGQPDSFLELHRLLEDQAYRIAFWRVAADEINYRRFFDINDLAGLRIEQPELFELAHQLVFRLIGEGRLQGLRLDHIDGLYDPVGYCERLQERAAYLLLQPQVAEAAPAAGGPAGVQLRQPFYLLVEKILAHHEHLREGWPVSGTSGYEFMNRVNGLFVDPAGESALTEAYARFIGRDTDFETVLLEAKRRIIETSLASELNVLAGALHRLAGQNWRTRDYTVTGVRRALTDIVVFLPVYRTYITAGRVGDDDRKYLDWAVGRARKHADAVDTSIYDFLHAALTSDLARRGPGYGTEDVLRVALKFQQYTGPVMAKSFEDTALYRYFRLVSLNEVGGDPARFGTTPTAFHHLNQERLRRFPFSLLSTATHDHKRGEDTRARINALSELPAHWSRSAWSWSRLNRARKRDVDGVPAPDLNDEYLLYQTLVGCWPFDPGLPADLAGTTDRVVAYMVKAVREAKRLSSWTSPNADYEDALERFVRGILDPVRSAAFLAEFQEFQGRVARIGAVNGLAQTLLKLTVPGVPDLYQGTEFWDLSLVDPDNRRPVDYAARQAALAPDTLAPDTAVAGTPDTAALLAGWRDGRIKQHVIARTLDRRRREPALFAAGDYVPVEATGAGADRVVAFLRRHGPALALVVVPRLVAPLLGEADVPLPPPARWTDTVLRLPALPEVASLTDALTGATLALPADGGLAVSAVLSAFPVALLVNAPGIDG